MFLQRNYGGENDSFHWQLTNDRTDNLEYNEDDETIDTKTRKLTKDWTDNLEYNEDDETMDTKRIKVRRGDKNVTAEESQVLTPTASPYDTESPTETLSPVRTLSQSATDHPALKREVMLEKNKYAARKCRLKKKEYVKCLEKRLAALENKNKTLMEELNSLGGLRRMTCFCRGGGSWL